MTKQSVFIEAYQRGQNMKNPNHLPRQFTRTIFDDIHEEAVILLAIARCARVILDDSGEAHDHNYVSGETTITVSEFDLIRLEGLLQKLPYDVLTDPTASMVEFAPPSHNPPAGDGTGEGDNT